MLGQRQQPNSKSSAAASHLSFERSHLSSRCEAPLPDLTVRGDINDVRREVCVVLRLGTGGWASRGGNAGAGTNQNKGRGTVAELGPVITR